MKVGRWLRGLPAALVVVLGAGGMSMAAAGRESPALMPMPKIVQPASGELVVDGSFTVAYGSFHDGRLERSVGRIFSRLTFETGSYLNPAPVSDPAQAKLVLDVRGPGEEVQSVDEDESYSLDVGPGQVHLRSATDVGAMRGLETLLQLVTLRAGRFTLPAMRIEDAPRFPWRGLMIDCGRHFEPAPVILRTLDGMAAVKLNVFHWHLSEDQGFRVESKRFPKLQGMGSDGLYYTQEQIRQVVAYARDRGIRVVPEFDMPGHATSWFVGYPELASGPGPYQVQRVFGIHDPAMDPSRESTYQFLDAFIGEMASLFPDPYLHIGGDESKGVQWMSNPSIVAFMAKKNLKDPAALQTYFNQRLLEILKKHGKHMVGWDEIFQPDLPKDVVVQSWRGQASLAAAARLGYQGILSAPYYLNRMLPAGTEYLADPLPAEANLTPAQAGLILGGEVCMWGEHIDSDTIDSVIWPRTAAIAERFWSPANLVDVSDMYRRLWVESLRLEQVGLTHISGPARMLRDLAGAEHSTTLFELASAIEPVSFRERSHIQHTDQLMPLDRLVDAVVPDPPLRFRMTAEVDELLSDPRRRARARELAAQFRRWQEISPSLEILLAGTPRLADAEPRAEQLSQLGTVGLAALDYLTRGLQPPAAWQQNALTVLAGAEKPDALVRFTFLDALRRLVAACASAGKQG